MLEGEDEAADGSIALGDGRIAARDGGSFGGNGDLLLAPAEMAFSQVCLSGVGAGSSSSFAAADMDAAEWEIDASEIDLGPRIGIGSFGEVFRGTWRHTDVAVKRFLEQDLSPQVLSVRPFLLICLAALSISLFTVPKTSALQ